MLRSASVFALVGVVFSPFDIVFEFEVDEIDLSFL